MMILWMTPVVDEIIVFILSKAMMINNAMSADVNSSDFSKLTIGHWTQSL